nr:MAG TPA: hypothetical protein [Bacteriophage sp.]
MFVYFVVWTYYLLTVGIYIYLYTSIQHLLQYRQMQKKASHNNYVQLFQNYLHHYN